MEEVKKEVKEGRRWDVSRTCASYAEALVEKHSVLKQKLQAKVHRTAEGTYRVKTRKKAKADD